jgi:hypothetical protein
MFYFQLQEHLKMERELRRLRRGDMARVLGDLLARARHAFGSLPSQERFWRIPPAGVLPSSPVGTSVVEPDLESALTLDDKGNGTVGISFDLDDDLALVWQLAAVVRMRVLGAGAIAMTIDGTPAYSLDAAPSAETFAPVLFEALRKRITQYIDAQP